MDMIKKKKRVQAEKVYRKQQLHRLKSFEIQEGTRKNMKKNIRFCQLQVRWAIETSATYFVRRRKEKKKKKKRKKKRCALINRWQWFQMYPLQEFCSLSFTSCLGRLSEHEQEEVLIPFSFLSEEQNRRKFMGRDELNSCR